MHFCGSSLEIMNKIAPGTSATAQVSAVLDSTAMMCFAAKTALSPMLDYSD
jgi:hypothetical protein